MTEGVLDLATFLMGGATGQGDFTEPYAPIAYPLELPAVSGVVALRWHRDKVRGRSESPYTLQSQHFPRIGGRWRVDVVLPKMSRANAAAWNVFLLNLEEGAGTVLFGDILNPLPRGSAAGSPLVDGANQTGLSLNFKGAKPNVPGFLLKDDKIQLGNWLYAVRQDANTDGSGMGTLDIWPRFRESPGDETAIITANARGRFRLAESGGPLGALSLDGAYEMPAFQLIEDV